MMVALCVKVCESYGSERKTVSGEVLRHYRDITIDKLAFSSYEAAWNSPGIREIRASVGM